MTHRHWRGTPRMLAAAALGLVACASPDGPNGDARAVYVDSVKLDSRTDTPVMLLVEESGERRELPIWIGIYEAQSIAMAMEEVRIPRPNTHDLIKNLLDGIRGEIERVVVTELRGSTYYAVIQVALDGRSFTIDSRPSDAIAVAVRAGAPIFATDRVLVQAASQEGAEPPVSIDWTPPSAPQGPRVHVH